MKRQGNVQSSKSRAEAVILALGLLPFALAVQAAPTDAGHSPAPMAGASPNVKQIKEGELDVSITGTRKDKLNVGKIDPPAAFNLEDIQNFPEERLLPVLNNPINFEEGRDFSTMMDLQEEQLYHPWLPELPRPPFLNMKVALDKSAREWSFSVIDQAGTTVSKQEGKGSPPDVLSWAGEDSVRDHAAVDTVYIPQLAVTDKEGYHHTYMGQPVQLSALLFKDRGKTVMELSTRRLFQEKKTDLTKEAPTLLDKVCDILREESRLPFAIQSYDNDSDLARSRTQVLAKYFSEKLYIPENQIVLPNPVSADKRGAAMAIVSNATPGGSQ
jgi:hypothetical protein